MVLKCSKGIVFVEWELLEGIQMHSDWKGRSDIEVRSDRSFVRAENLEVETVR